MGVKKMSNEVVGQWDDFYKRVKKFPWVRIARLVANEKPTAEIEDLLLRYEQLKVESAMHLPHGPGLFKRLDRLSNQLQA
jgi:hypothetical protein